MRRREHQSGFSTSVILLAVLVVAALAVTGLVVYQHHKNSTKNSAATSPTQTTTQPQSTTTTQPAQTTTQYLDIKEWGIRASYSGSLTLQYTANGSNSMSVSSSQLAAGGPAVCSAAGNSDAGILSRYLPTDSNLGPKIPANETAQQYIDQNATVPHATIGNHIYIYWGNNYLTNGVYNGPCNDKTAALQTISAYSDLVPNLAAVQ